MSPLPSRSLSRRDFVREALAVSSLTALGDLAFSSAAAAEEKPMPPVAVFSKVYQELSLSFEQAAALTAEAGLNGVDCPVRPGGEVLPERVAEDLPRYVSLLRQHKLSMPLITTAITSVNSACAEAILRTAKTLGVQFYRFGFIYRETSRPVAEQIRELRAQLRELAALNKQIGIGALFQNHSPSGQVYLGGDLAEMRDILADFDPAQVGLAFDIGHALIVHGEKWREHFEALKPHLKIAYIKDAKPDGRFVPFGEGEIGRVGYFKLLRDIGYREPFSLHLEYDWTEKGKSKDCVHLLEALRDSSAKLEQWYASA